MRRSRALRVAAGLPAPLLVCPPVKLTKTPASMISPHFYATRQALNCRGPSPRKAGTDTTPKRRIRLQWSKNGKYRGDYLYRRRRFRYLKAMRKIVDCRGKYLCPDLVRTLGSRSLDPGRNGTGKLFFRSAGFGGGKQAGSQQWSRALTPTPTASTARKLLEFCQPSAPTRPPPRSNVVPIRPLQGAKAAVARDRVSDWCAGAVGFNDCRPCRDETHKVGFSRALTYAPQPWCAGIAPPLRTARKPNPWSKGRRDLWQIPRRCAGLPPAGAHPIRRDRMGPWTRVDDPRAGSIMSRTLWRLVPATREI